MTGTSQVATELRDGLLQDLVAVGLIMGAVRRSLGRQDDGSAHALLDSASAALEADVSHLRSVIDRLGPVA